MNRQIEIDEFMQLSTIYTVVDVRTPSEYQHAHIPGAINIPLFSDEERKKVGICYKKEGREPAIMLGLKLVGPKLAELAKNAKKTASENKMIVHCWRGGMRSSSMAWLFNTVGIQTYTLKGGYKTYRRHIKAQLAQNAKLLVLGGMTGSGKTRILEEIEKSGHQVIDLEYLANHKGSAFGALGQKQQCTSEQFENDLFEIWKKLDLNKTIWIEDESKTIGKIVLPDELYLQIRKAPVISIEIPVEERIKYLFEEYGNFDPDELKKSLEKIQKRLGGKNMKLAVEAIDNKELTEAIRIVLYYYDRTYQYGLSQRNSQSIYKLSLKKINHSFNAREIINFLKNINN